MPSDQIETPLVSEVIGVNDPGEIGREHHTVGDRFVVWISNVMAWMFPALIVAIVAQIILRGVGNNQAWLDDLQWWMYGVAILAGFAYAITTNSHVRVDIFYDRYTDRRKAKVEIFGLAWLLMPFILIMTDILFHYAVSSWLAREGSDSPNGLHKLYLLKTAIPLLLFVAFIAAWSAFYRNLKSLTYPALWKQLLFALPTSWFIVNRIVYYATWWYYRLTQPDLNPRRIGKEALFDHTLTISVVLVLAILIVAYWKSRHRKSSASEVG